MLPPRLSLAPSPREGHAAIAALAATGDDELPDANLTEERRHTMKRVARAFGWHFTSHELIYLAGALEAEANAKRAEES